MKASIETNKYIYIRMDGAIINCPTLIRQTQRNLSGGEGGGQILWATEVNMVGSVVAQGELYEPTEKEWQKEYPGRDVSRLKLWDTSLGLPAHAAHPAIASGCKYYEWWRTCYIRVPLPEVDSYIYLLPERHRPTGRALTSGAIIERSLDNDIAISPFLPTIPYNSFDQRPHPEYPDYGHPHCGELFWARLPKDYNGDDIALDKSGRYCLEL